MILCDRIKDVLSEAEKPLDIEEIAVQLAERGHISDFGVMPRKLICSIIEDAITNEGDQSPFVRTERGVFISRKMATSEQIQISRSLPSGEISDLRSIFTCCGEVWSRDISAANQIQVNLIGCQHQQSPKINFSKQIGVYALIVKNPAVGAFFTYSKITMDRTFGECLHRHTVDRFASRWNRFTFLGLLPIREDGTFGALPSRCTKMYVKASLRKLLLEAQISGATAESLSDYLSLHGFMQSLN